MVLLHMLIPVSALITLLLPSATLSLSSAVLSKYFSFLQVHFKVPLPGSLLQLLQVAHFSPFSEFLLQAGLSPCRRALILVHLLWLKWRTPLKLAYTCDENVPEGHKGGSWNPGGRLHSWALWGAEPGTKAAALSRASALLLSVLLHSLLMEWLLGCSMSMTWSAPSCPLRIILCHLVLKI